MAPATNAARTITATRGQHTARGRSTARGLLLACHPLPCLAVTLLSTGLGALAHLDIERLLLVSAVELAGQLSIGWSNDWLDAGRDAAVQRTDKPVATGSVATGAVAGAAALALTTTCALAVALGWRAAVVCLAGVACGWLYNLWLKATLVSWLPYALAFGTLPAVATLTAPRPHWPTPWTLAAATVLGIAAHLANVLPDLRGDVATGVRGLPHRIGARASALATIGLLWAALVIIVLQPGRHGGWWRWTAGAAGTIGAVTAAATVRRDPSSRWFFAVSIAVAAADLALFALRGARL